MLVMARILLILITAMITLAAVRMAIVGLLLAGLIFRTRETLGLLIALGAYAFLKAQPLIVGSLIGVGLLALLIRAAVSGRKARTVSEPLKLLE